MRQALRAHLARSGDCDARTGRTAGRCAGRAQRWRATRFVDAGEHGSAAAAASGTAVPIASAGSVPVPASQATPASPPPQVRNVLQATPNNQQLATLPPSASPQDEYDMAYGYVLHKDYSLAEQSFRDYLKKYPNERLAARGAILARRKPVSATALP